MLPSHARPSRVRTPGSGESTFEVQIDDPVELLVGVIQQRLSTLMLGVLTSTSGTPTRSAAAWTLPESVISSSSASPLPPSERICLAVSSTAPAFTSAQNTRAPKAASPWAPASHAAARTYHERSSAGEVEHRAVVKHAHPPFRLSTQRLDLFGWHKR